MNLKHSFPGFQMLFLYACLFFIGVNAKCNTDNCLNAFNNHGGYASYSPFCSSFLATTYTATTTGLGPFPSQCSNSPSKLSSACSCIASTTSASSKTTTSPTISTDGSTTTITVTATVTGTCSATGFPTTVTTVSGAPPTFSATTLTVTSVSLSTTTTTVTTSIIAQPTCPQIVINGDFEAGNLADWTNDYDNPDATFSVVTSALIPGGSHSGFYSAALIFDPDGPFLPYTPADMYQSVSAPQLCSAGQQYLFQMFVKTVANTCYVNAYDNDSGESFIDILLTPGGATPPWVEMSIVITPGTSFELVIEATCVTEDTVWFDDISLAPV